MSAVADVAVTEARFEFGRVVGQTFGLIGRNFLLFGLLAFFFVGVPQFIVLYLQAQAFNTGNTGEASALSAIAGLVNVAVGYILIGALTRASVDDLSGAGVKLGAAFADGFRFFLPLLLLLLLVCLGVGLGFVLLIVPGIILGVRWIVAGPIMVIERIGPTNAMGRSAELGRGNRWAIFGLLALYFVLVYALQFAGGAIIGIGRPGVSMVTPLVTMDALGVVFALILVGINVVISLVKTVGTSALYFELRRVKEGVGVEQLASVFD